MEGKKKFQDSSNNKAAVAECYMQFQQSHRPRDLWHMVTPDYRKAAIWLQFKTGDSKND